MLRQGCLWIILITLAFSLPTGALAQAPTQTGAAVKDVAIEIGDNAVRYPQLQGMKDETVQQKINDDIVLAGDITAHILTLSGLANSAWGLRVEAESFLDANVFSTVIHAKGKQPNGRNGQSSVALSYDLRTGERVKLGDLFLNEAQAVKRMEAIAEETLSFEMSEYMENAALLPLPESSFFIDGDGITFYYPSEQFSYVSGYAGACGFFYDELAELLKTDEDGLPARMGILSKPLTAKETAQRIRDAVRVGALPHLPVTLGQSMPELAQRYRLVREPDKFPGGRYFVMEAPQFRSVLLISDAMQSGYDHSVLEGIQLKRGGLFGLMVGSSPQAEWRTILGAPDETITFTDGMAYDYGLPKGASDLYRVGDYTLRLHADEDGTLRCIQLEK